jgi:hypothetical protein
MSLIDYCNDILHKDVDNYKRITKVCVWCHMEKDIKEFPRHKAHKGGYDSRCRKCKQDSNKLVEKLKKTAPPKPEVCPICQEVPKKWVLDHDHKTKTFRGWLCDPCNLALGKFKESIKILVRAANYIRGNLND